MFFDPDNDWSQRAARVVAELPARFAADGLRADNHAVVALREEGRARPSGYAHRGDWGCYPCSLVKSFHLVHALAALDAGWLAPHPELDRALRDMILWSSNTATNYVIDLLTGTTGDTLLDGAALADWMAAREGLNRWFDSLNWPEMAGCNLTQKLMDDTRYGREAQFAAQRGGYLNRLTPLATARLMAALFDDSLRFRPPQRPGRRRFWRAIRRGRRPPIRTISCRNIWAGRCPRGCGSGRRPGTISGPAIPRPRGSSMT